MHFASVPDWSERKDLSAYIGKAPRTIRQIKVPKYGKMYGGYTMAYNTKYPKVFPFELTGKLDN